MGIKNSKKSKKKRKPVLGCYSNIKQGKMLPESEHLMDMYNSESWTGNTNPLVL